MALRVRVCRAGDVPPGEMRGFEVEGLAVPILVVNVDGTYLATTSLCPHDDVSLLWGARAGKRIVCPGHGYQFDLETGACTHDPRLTLARYRVTVEHGHVYVDLV